MDDRLNVSHLSVEAHRQIIDLILQFLNVNSSAIAFLWNRVKKVSRENLIGTLQIALLSIYVVNYINFYCIPNSFLKLYDNNINNSILTLDSKDIESQYCENLAHREGYGPEILEKHKESFINGCMVPQMNSDSLLNNSFTNYLAELAKQNNISGTLYSHFVRGAKRFKQINLNSNIKDTDTDRQLSLFKDKFSNELNINIIKFISLGTTQILGSISLYAANNNSYKRNLKIDNVNSLIDVITNLPKILDYSPDFSPESDLSKSDLKKFFISFLREQDGRNLSIEQLKIEYLTNFFQKNPDILKWNKRFNSFLEVQDEQILLNYSTEKLLNSFFLNSPSDRALMLSVGSYLILFVDSFPELKSKTKFNEIAQEITNRDETYNQTATLFLSQLIFLFNPFPNLKDTDILSDDHKKEAYKKAPIILEFYPSLLRFRLKNFNQKFLMNFIKEIIKENQVNFDGEIKRNDLLNTLFKLNDKIKENYLPDEEALSNLIFNTILDALLFFTEECPKLFPLPLSKKESKADYLEKFIKDNKFNDPKHLENLINNKFNLINYVISSLYKIIHNMNDPVNKANLQNLKDQYNKQLSKFIEEQEEYNKQLGGHLEEILKIPSYKLESVEKPSVNLSRTSSSL